MYKVIDLVYEAASSLGEVIGVPIDIQKDHKKYDAVIRIKEVTFYCIAKKYAKNESYTTLKKALSSIKENENKLLITGYLPPQKAQFLKQNRVNYIDSSGNAYIEAGDLFLYITGREPKMPSETNQTRAFQETGLKLLLLLLAQPESVSWSYRKLAKKTGISIGSISNIFKELEAERYLLKDGRKRVLKNREAIIKRWGINYKDFLKPRIKRQRMRSIDPNFNASGFLKIDLDFYFGGEPGGQLLTQYLKPEQFIIYSNEEIKKIAQTLRLVPDKNGNIELCHKFWSDAIRLENAKVAPKLVVYADLVNTGNNRNIETAEIIRKNGL